MLLLAPSAILALTGLALAASNLQRGFRSSWMVALIGASLAWSSLLFLRLQLPLTLSFIAWPAGAGLEYSASFALDDLNWTLAFLATSLCVAAILGQARHAVGAAWHSWAPSLVVGAATYLAIVSGDSLTLVFCWTLLDILTAILLLLYVQRASQRRALFSACFLNLPSSLILLAAWTLSFYGGELTAALVVLAVIFRFGLLAPHLRLIETSSLRDDLGTTLLLVPMAATLAALTRSPALLEPARSVFLLVLLIVCLYLSFRALLDPKSNWHVLWELAAAGLAIAAAIGGQTLAVIAFSSQVLVGNAVKALVQNLPKFRLPAALLAATLLLGLPLTASQYSLSVYTNWSSPVIFGFLLVQAALLAAWLRRARLPRESSAPPEAWMRNVEWLALAVVPVVYVLLGVGLLPIFGQPTQPPLWPLAVVGLMTMALFFGTPRLVTFASPRFRQVVELLFSLEWLEIMSRLLSKGASRVLTFANLLLEGKAGVLWAMLLMALLISLAGQFGLGG